MSTVQIRYIVNDVDTAIAFYTQHLGFDEVMHPAPTFAMLSRGDLRLVLSAPSGPNTGGGSALPDGRIPQPGGWNRFAVQVDDIAAVQRGYAKPAWRSAATSSMALAGGRRSSRILRATRSSCSNQGGRRPACRSSCGSTSGMGPRSPRPRSRLVAMLPAGELRNLAV